MQKNIVSKEDIMDKWYAYIDNDYAEPNARLYCKLEDCPKKEFTKTNRRRHLKRHHPEVFKFLYDPNYSGGFQSKLQIEREDYQSDPVQQGGEVIKQESESESEDETIKKIETVKSVNPAYGGANFETTTFSELLGGEIQHNEEEDVRKQQEEINQYRMDQRQKQERLNALEREEQRLRQKAGRNSYVKVNKLGSILGGSSFENTRNNFQKQVNQFKYTTPAPTRGGYSKKSKEASRLKKELDNEIKNHNNTALNLEIITNKYDDMKKKLKYAIKKGNKKEIKEVVKYVDNNKEALELMEASVSLCKKYERVINDNVKDLTKLRDEIARYKDAIDKRVKVLETFRDEQVLTNKEVKRELQRRPTKDEIETMISKQVKQRVKEEVEKFIKEKGLDFSKDEVSKMVDEDMKNTLENTKSDEDTKNTSKKDGDTKDKNTDKKLKEDTAEEALKKWLETDAGEGRGKNKGGLTEKSKKSLVHIFVTHRKNSLDNIKKYVNSIRINRSKKPNKNTRHKILLKKELKTYIKNYEVNKT
jgi:hypothetical protein